MSILDEQMWLRCCYSCITPKMPPDVLWCNARINTNWTSQTCWAQRWNLEEAVGESRFSAAQLLQIVELKIVVDESRPLNNGHLSPHPVCDLSDIGGPLNFALAGCLCFFRGRCVGSCGHPDSMNLADQWEQSQLVICWQMRQTTKLSGPVGNNCLDILMWWAPCDEDFFVLSNQRAEPPVCLSKSRATLGQNTESKLRTVLKTCTFKTLQCGLLLFS